MNQYNKYIESIDEKKCMDCGSSKVVIRKDEKDKSVKNV